MRFIRALTKINRDAKKAQLSAACNYWVLLRYFVQECKFCDLLRVKCYVVLVRVKNEPRNVPLVGH